MRQAEADRRAPDPGHWRRRAARSRPAPARTRAHRPGRGTRSARHRASLVHERAVAPLEHRLALRAARASRGTTSPATPKRATCSFVDRVERARRVTRQHVGEARREPAPDDDPGAAAPARRCRGRASAPSVGRDRRAMRTRSPRRRPRRRPRGVDVARQRRRDRVDALGNGSSRPQLDALGAVVAARRRPHAPVLAGARRRSHGRRPACRGAAGRRAPRLRRPRRGGTVLTGSRGPAAPATRRTSAARGPCPAPSPPRSRRPRSAATRSPRWKAFMTGRVYDGAHTAQSGSPDGPPGCAARSSARRSRRPGGSTRPRSRRARSSVDSSQPRIALVGKHRFENVHTKGPPGRTTRATSRNTSIGRTR